MKFFSVQLISMALFTLLFSCGPSTQTEKENQTGNLVPELADSIPNKTKASPIGDNSMTSLDWEGTYTATLPCASCEGITFWLTLNLDSTFELKTSYMGLNDARDEIFTGKFIWDEQGSMVTLQGLVGEYPRHYLVGENQIWQLDPYGNRIDGDLAERYILKKK